jgi:hypothetical protein
MILAMFVALTATPEQPPATSTPPVHVIRRNAPPPPLVTGDHASVPLDFVAGFPTITATIGGKSFRIGIDSGAPGGAHLTDRVVAALDLQPVGEALAGDPSGKNLVRLKLYPVNDLEIGTVKVTNWVGTAAPATQDKLEAIDGIIGPQAFAGFVVTLDYAGGHLSLDRGALPEPDGKRIFSYDDVIPVVPVTIEGRTIQAHLDTGNVSMPVIVPEDFANQLPRKAEARIFGVAHTVSNAIQMKAVPISGAVIVGNTPISIAEVGFPSVINRANIGSLALSGLIVRIDPANRRVSFSRALASNDEL